MEFGTQQVFDYIKYNLSNAKNEFWYDRLFYVIKGDVLSLISLYKLQATDKDDIIQEVQLSVTLHLVQFICDSEDKTMEQRNTWLRKIVKSKVMDFFRKKYKTLETSIEDVSMIPECQMEFLSCNDIEKNFQKFVRENEFLGALKKLFSINTSPEKIVAFVFNRIIATTEFSKKNGSPKEIVKRYTGIKIETMFEIMKEELEERVPFKIPSEVYLPLVNKIDEATQKGNVEILFMLSPRGITDSSNWITKKIKEKEEEE